MIYLPSSGAFLRLLLPLAEASLSVAAARMAKSKNHSNHNQAYKAHRNGLRKPSRVRWISTKGVRHQATANNVTGARFGAALWLRARRPRCPPPAAGRWSQQAARWLEVAAVAARGGGAVLGCSGWARLRRWQRWLGCSAAAAPAFAGTVRRSRAAACSPRCCLYRLTRSSSATSARPSASRMPSRSLV